MDDKALLVEWYILLWQGYTAWPPNYFTSYENWYDLNDLLLFQYRAQLILPFFVATTMHVNYQVHVFQNTRTKRKSKRMTTANIIQDKCENTPVGCKSIHNDGTLQFNTVHYL